MEERILRPSRWKTIAFLVMSVGFVAGGLLGVARGMPVGWLPAIFFALCAAFFAVTLFPSAAYLRLHGEGFEMRALFRSVHIMWRDVGAIGITRVGLNQMVAFNFSADYSEQTRARALSRGMSGWEGGIPDVYGYQQQRWWTS